MKRFLDKVAVITGATSGIGRATALAFAKEGAHVAIAGRRLDRLEAVAREARGLGVTALCLQGDVCDPSRLKTWARAVGEKFGHADYLINGAGVLGGGSISDTPDEEWDRQMNTNVRALFQFTREMAPLLKKGTNAAVVNVSSVTGHRPYSNLVAYCTSKAAVDMITRCASLDFAPFGIRVNAVNPGVVRTELHTVTGAVADYDAFLERSKGTHPLGRIGEPAEIADSILFLCSKDAAWITGSTLPVDGGRGLSSAR